MSAQKPGAPVENQLLVDGSSMTSDQEVMGLNPAMRWTFFYNISYSVSHP